MFNFFIKEVKMKKILLIAGMILAVMMVVQPTYAATGGTFNIVVTVSSYSVELLKHDGLAQYNDWEVTVPPHGMYTMTANQAVMVSLTGDLGNNGMEIVSFVGESNSWNAVLPDPQNPIAQNDFVLLADVMMNEPFENGMPLAMSNPRPITYEANMPLDVIPNNDDKAWVIYSLHVADMYTNPHETIEVIIEVKPVP